MGRHRAPSTLAVEEPVALGAAVVTLVQAALGALVALDVIDLTAEQTAALMGAVTAAVAVAGGILVRARTTPAGMVAARVEPDSGLVVAGSAVDIGDGLPVTVTRHRS